MDLHSAMIAGIGEDRGHLAASWLVEGDVRDETVTEKSGDALAGAVEELIGDQEFSRTQIFLQRANRADGDNPLYTDLLHRKDIGAEINFARENAVATAVARQKCHSFAFERTGYDGVGGITEGRLYANLAGVGQALHGVEAAAADDADGY